MFKCFNINKIFDKNAFGLYYGIKNNIQFTISKVPDSLFNISLNKKNFTRRNIKINTNKSTTINNNTILNNSQAEKNNESLKTNASPSASVLSQEKEFFSGEKSDQLNVKHDTQNKGKINTDKVANQRNPEDSLSENLYIKILSSLSKQESIDKDDFLKRLGLLKDKLKLSEINDQEILDLMRKEEEKPTTESINQINNLIEEEVSEEEFAAESGVRFRRPPHTFEELKQTLEEADKLFEKNKVSFLGQEEKDLEELGKSFMKNIPKHMKVSILNYPANNADIVLLGVSRFSNMHALWTSDFLNKFEPDGIAIEFPPDDPIFIEGNDSHNQEWKNFITKNIDYKFKVNPLPQNVNDLVLTPSNIESLIHNNFDKSEKIKITPKLIFSDHSIK